MTGIGIQCIDIKLYDEPEIVESEILRYAKCGPGSIAPDSSKIESAEVLSETHVESAGVIFENMAYKDAMNMVEIMRECVEEARKVIKYHVIYKTAKINFEKLSFDSLLNTDERTNTANEFSGVMHFDFGDSILTVDSKDLCGNFMRNNCNHAVFFAATLGHDMDRLIRKYSAISPAKALFMQAIGAERIEALCDAFESEVKESFASKAPRFSPGFGDLTLELQRDFARILDLDRKLGIKVGENLLMSPTKSVTAIIGVRV